MSTHAPAREISDNHSGSRSMHANGDEDTVGVSGEVPHERCTLNAYIYLF